MTSHNLSRGQRAAGAAVRAAALLLAFAIGFAIQLSSASCEQALASDSSREAAMAAIEKGLKAHSAEIDLGEGVNGSTIDDIVKPFAKPSDGLFSRSDTESRLLFDRYSAYPKAVYEEWGEDDILYASRIKVGYYASAEVNAKAEKKVRSVARAASKRGSAYKRLLYIHDWLVKNSAYTGYSSSKWKKASSYGVRKESLNHCSASIIVGHWGRCNSYTLAFLRICKAAGFKDVRYVRCKSQGSKTVNHCIAAVRYKGALRYIDATWDEMNYRRPNGSKFEVPSGVRHTYFLKTKSYMLKADHDF